MSFNYQERRKKRHARIRKGIFGTPEKPRLCIFRSGKHLYAQAVDDYRGRTLFSFSTNGEKFRKAVSKNGAAKTESVEAAKKLGEIFGPEIVAKGIGKIVFDRGGYKYHGRVKALAEALRQAGISF